MFRTSTVWTSTVWTSMVWTSTVWTSAVLAAALAAALAATGACDAGPADRDAGGGADAVPDSPLHSGDTAAGHEQGGPDRGSRLPDLATSDLVQPDLVQPDLVQPDLVQPDLAAAPDAGQPQPPTKLRYGMNVDPANPKGNPAAKTLKAAGVRWVRIEYKSSKGQALYDPLIAAHRAAGLQVLLLVDYASVPGKPASDASSSQWTAYLSLFDKGLAGIAKHYGDGVDAWQVWNEPDLPKQPGYDPGMPAATFGQLLAAAVKTIGLHSTRPVISGGLASGSTSYVAAAVKAAGPLTVDALAVHPYGQRAPDDWPHASWGFGNMSSLLKAYLAFGKPIWISEIGTDVTSPATFQADYLQNVYLLTKQLGKQVPVVFWFCWSDGMVSPYGVLDAQGKPKPAHARYKKLAGSW